MIKHEVGQAMKETIELVAGTVGGGDLVGGGAARRATAERRDACGARGVGATQASNLPGTDSVGTRHGRNVSAEVPGKKTPGNLTMDMLCQEAPGLKSDLDDVVKLFVMEEAMAVDESRGRPRFDQAQPEVDLAVDVEERLVRKSGCQQKLSDGSKRKDTVSSTRRGWACSIARHA